MQLTASCNEGRTVIQLVQTRFSLGAQSFPAQEWQIPIVLARGKERRSLLLDKATGSATFNGCSQLPVLANPDGLGFYRVAYDSATLRNLAESFARLSPAQQVALLSDTFALAQAGRVTMPQYFDLLAAIVQVNGAGRSALFTLAIDHLKSLELATAGTPAQARVQSAPLIAESRARAPWTESETC